MVRLAEVSSRVRFVGGNYRWFAFFALALLWLWMIAVVGGYTSWAVHSLLLVALATGFVILEQSIGLVSAARRFFRNLFQCRSLVSLGQLTRDVYVNLQRVPIHVALGVAYLVGLFSTAIFLLLTMTN